MVKNIDKINIKVSDRLIARPVSNGNACPVPKLVKIAADDSVSLEGKSNAGIEITRDFPKGLYSGYGAKAHHKCSTIDIVAGRLSKFSRTETDKEEPLYCDNSFEHDAARIYISEKTDIDDNFKIRSSSGFSLPSVGRSAVGIKADSIRILGNEGVKIVTGVYRDCSRGTGTAPTATPAGIELIAMNSTEGAFEVQPMVKGHNTVELFRDVFKLIDSLSGLVEQFITCQSNINKYFAEHNHLISVGPTLHPSPPPAIGLNDEFVRGMEEQNAAKTAIMKQLENVSKFILLSEQMYLGAESKNYICSLYNGVN